MNKPVDPITEGIACIELIKEHIDEDNEFILDPLGASVCKKKTEEISKNSFFFFAKYVLEFDLMTETEHKKWADDLQTIFFKIFRIMRLKPRGTYKTTLYGIAFILWVWSCIDKRIRIFYTSASSLLLEEVSDKLTQFLNPDDDSVFQFVFGIKRDDRGKFSPKNTGDVFNIEGRSGKGFSLILRTAGGSTVGIHPNLIIVDDPMDKDDRDSKAIRDKKNAWFDTLHPLLVPFYTEDGKLIEHVMFIATRWHRLDLVHHIFKQIKENIEHGEEWDIEIESVYDDDGVSPRYPVFFPLNKINKTKAGISDIFFACQYCNNPLPEGLRVFVEDRLTFVRPDQVAISEGSLTCFFDPSRGKEASDWPAVIWVHYHNRTLTLHAAMDKEKIELHTLLQLMANENKLMGVNHVIFEDNGVSLMEQNIKDAHARINHPVFCEPVYHSSNKHERILSMQPDLYTGFVQFYHDWKVRYPNMMDQILYYPGAEYDDFPDVVEMAVSHFKGSNFEFVRYEGCY